MRHDPALISLADRVIELKDGRVVGAAELADPGEKVEPAEASAGSPG